MRGRGVAEREAVGEKRERERMWVVGGFGSLDKAGRGSDRLLTATGQRQCDDQACPGDPTESSTGLPSRTWAPSMSF